MASNIGMMDSAYFVGRNEILTWINNCLQLNLSRIEEAASGAVQCQMIDMTYPGAVPMHKVNFDAKTEYDMIQNYKVLQDVFNKLKIEKYWIINSVFFRFCPQLFLECHNRNYNPVERRCKGGKGGATMKGCQKAAKSLQTHNMHSHGSGDSVEPRSKPGKNGVTGGTNSSTEIQALSKEITELKMSVDLLEKERDFYFAKLRDIEIFCQMSELEDLPMTAAIKMILYAADAKESALTEAQEYIYQSQNRSDVENENEE
uniref:Protein ATEB1 homolog 2 n=1 Tax=Cucumis sativus TaxID=3659 RepID=A0A0A0LT98_CUCSA